MKTHRHQGFCCAPPGSRTQNLRIKSPAQPVRPVLSSPQNRGFVRNAVQGVLPNPPQSGEFVAKLVARDRASCRGDWACSSVCSSARCGLRREAVHLTTASHPSRHGRLGVGSTMSMMPMPNCRSSSEMSSIYTESMRFLGETSWLVMSGDHQSDLCVASFEHDGSDDQ